MQISARVLGPKQSGRAPWSHGGLCQAWNSLERTMGNQNVSWYIQRNRHARVSEATLAIPSRTLTRSELYGMYHAPKLNTEQRIRNHSVALVLPVLTSSQYFLPCSFVKPMSPGSIGLAIAIRPLDPRRGFYDLKRISAMRCRGSNRFRRTFANDSESSGAKAWRKIIGGFPLDMGSLRVQACRSQCPL